MLALGQVRNVTAQTEAHMISMFFPNFLKKGTFHNFMNEPQQHGQVRRLFRGAEQWYRAVKARPAQEGERAREGWWGGVGEGGMGGRGSLLEPQVSWMPLMYGVTQGHKPGPRWSGKARQGSWESNFFLFPLKRWLCVLQIWAEEV